MPDRRRFFLFAAVAAVCVLAAAAAIAAGIHGSEGSAESASAARATLRHPAVMFSSPRRKGQVDVAALGRARGPAKPTGLRCDRVYYAGGHGICLARGGGFAAGYRVRMFDRDLRVRRALAVEGVPSRARVSPDGRYGSVTMFVSGHAYADPGMFSTRTTMIEMATGRKIADLEQFTVLKGRRQVTALDVNFWGVTFARDSDRFYATMATGGQTYLIRGSVRARTARVLAENVECPSLSPDGTRIAFKRRTDSESVSWHLTVLDLRSMRETALAEPRSIDDQAEWLDDGRVLYGHAGTVWVVPADGSGAAQRFLAGAGSPAVVARPSGARNAVGQPF